MKNRLVWGSETHVNHGVFFFLKCRFFAGLWLYFTFLRFLNCSEEGERERQGGKFPQETDTRSRTHSHKTESGFLRW